VERRDKLLDKNVLSTTAPSGEGAASRMNNIQVRSSLQQFHLDSQSLVGEKTDAKLFVTHPG
jgi:hypothetical protein